MKFMPDKDSEITFPEREYFWNVANTVQNDYVQKTIKHANDQRMSAQKQTEQAETIEITQEWWNKLNSVPFVSCKF